MSSQDQDQVNKFIIEDLKLMIGKLTVLVKEAYCEGCERTCQPWQSSQAFKNLQIIQGPKQTSLGEIIRAEIFAIEDANVLKIINCDAQDIKNTIK